MKLKLRDKYGYIYTLLHQCVDQGCVEMEKLT
jgi:hypothetical protein